MFSSHFGRLISVILKSQSESIKLINDKCLWYTNELANMKSNNIVMLALSRSFKEFLSMELKAQLDNIKKRYNKHILEAKFPSNPPTGK